jgi:S1-C subfamily serine protease
MRVLATLVITLLSLSALTLASDWDIPDLKKTVLRLERTASDGAVGICSAVVYAPGKALTAAHCVDHSNADFTLAGRHATVIEQNRGLDIATMKFKPKDEVPIVLATSVPKAGREVAMIGFAFGKPDLHAQFGRVANSRDQDGYTVLNMDTIFGDSGGAVIDRKGQLVGIVSAIYANGPAHLGLAVPIDTVRDFIEEDKK